MYLKYYTISSIFAMLALLSSPINAQESSIKQLLQGGNVGENFGLNFSARDLEKLSGDISEIKTLPISDSPEIPNVNSSNENTMGNSDITNFKPMTKIEEYYYYLTNQKMPMFGQTDFSNFEDKNILFYNSVGKDYTLAPGDVLKITIRGLSQLNKDVQINESGEIIIPDLFPVFVEGLTVKEVEVKILNLLKFDDSAAAVNINLTGSRLIPVQVTGAVGSPQTIAVPAYTPISRIIPKVGGIRKDGSFRNIVLTDLTNSKKRIDLYGLLRSNDKFEDHLINNPTRLHINDIGFTVGVTGFVGRHGIFELPHNRKEIKATKLLELANAKMIPPGALIEVLKFNTNGVVQRERILNLDDMTIKAGEVLNIELPQTANLEAVSVQGAVINSYNVNESEPTTLAEILKYGATLTDDALLNFAIIKPRSSSKQPIRSVDLHYAFANPDKILISPGESIIILNSTVYNLILNHAQKTGELKEIDLSKSMSLSNSNPESIQQQPDLKSFENRVNLLLETLEVNELLRNTQKIYIDNKLIELVPSLPSNSYVSIIKERINLPSNLNLDFALKIKNFGKTNETKISFSPKDVFNNNDGNMLPLGESSVSNIKLFSNSFLISLINDSGKNPVNTTQGLTIREKPYTNLIYKNDLEGASKASLNELALSEINQVRPVLLFVDDKLTYVVTKNTNIQKSVSLSLLANDPNIYPFIVRAERIKVSDSVVVPTPFYSSLTEIMTGNDILYKAEFFTYEFIRKLLGPEIELTDIIADNGKKNRQQINQEGLSQEGLSQLELQLRLNQLELNQLGLNQDNEPNEFINADQKNAPTQKEFQHFNAIKRNSKLVSGALEDPGFYPIIGEVSLKDLISIAGGLLPGADLENVTIRNYGNSKGSTDIVGTKYFDITSINPKRIILSGYFTLYIPYLVNNADVGTIDVEGEVLHPGKYSFSRNETLAEVLIRAGGFTNTAYPLGASFHRESLKNEQKLSNENLAREVEQSILFLSQSQLSGAGDQIKAVVAYANQLKNMPALGKQTLDIEGSSREMLLQNGDKLFIPKRPSHVTISGSVQNPVTTVYNPDKALEHYISDAGGFKRIADKKNIFILLPNGRNITLSSLQSERAPIPAGSVIVVPPKTDKLSALGLTDIWSRVLGNIATSILAINAATR